MCVQLNRASPKPNHECQLVGLTPSRGSHSLPRGALQTETHRAFDMSWDAGEVLEIGAKAEVSESSGPAWPGDGQGLVAFSMDEIRRQS